MFNMSRRDVVRSAGLAAALGLEFPSHHRRDRAGAARPRGGNGLPQVKVGSVEVTALYDGVWRKPHDPTFIKNASIDETKDALAKAGMTTDYVPIPLTVVVLKIGDRLVMVDAGSGVVNGSRTSRVRQNMKAGWDRSREDQYHPALAFSSRPHFWIDGKGHQRADLSECRTCAARRIRWWTEPGRVEKLPEGRKALGAPHPGGIPAMEEFPAGRRRSRSGAGRPAG